MYVLLWIVRDSVHGRVKIICFLRISRSAVDPPTQHPVLWVFRGQTVLPVVKNLGHEAHRPTSNTEMNEWSYTFTPLLSDKFTIWRVNHYT